METTYEHYLRDPIAFIAAVQRRARLERHEQLSRAFGALFHKKDRAHAARAHFAPQG